MVLVVGSHEPRKNHLAVLHAAELLWRRGTAVQPDLHRRQLLEQRAVRRHPAGLQTARPAGRVDLRRRRRPAWGAYRLARFTVFPSLNEGFGLPVVESIACGTPVITSDFGSMREIADAGGGALLVDPRDDHAMADAMRTLLTDDAELERLAKQARQRPLRTWDTYADETWDLLTR